jgi:molybdopterin-binding protein
MMNLHGDIFPHIASGHYGWLNAGKTPLRTMQHCGYDTDVKTMPIFMTIHDIPSDEATPERVKQIAQAGQASKYVRGYRSFHSLNEGRIVWLLEAKSRADVQAWCDEVGLPLTGITAVDMEGHIGVLRPVPITLPNQMRGKVIRIIEDGTIALVYIRVAETDALVSLVDAGVPAALALSEGSDVRVMFRASDISLAVIEKDKPLKLSFPNQIRGKVTQIISGPTLIIVHMETAAGPIVSAIIPSAAEAIGLKVGDEVTALFKALDVSLATDTDA